MVSLARSPHLHFSLVLVGLGVSGRWAASVNLGLGLDEAVAVLESTLGEVEEISDELGLLGFSDSLEQRGIHLLLEELIKVHLQVCLEKGLLSD